MAEPQPGAERQDESGAEIPIDAMIVEAGAGSATDLSDDDFLPQRPQKPPGPGLPESLAWMVGVVVLQFVGVVVGLVLAFGGQVLTTGPDEFLRNVQDPAFMHQLMKDNGTTLALFCGVQSVFLLGAVAAAMLRLGGNRRRFLPLGAVPAPHAVVIGLLIVPLMVFGESLFRFATEYWEWFVSRFPGLKGLGENNSMEQIAELVPNSPLPLLLILIAFVPAVAEELIFRGVIGRGLVARWGLPAGILLTSVLFAAVHVHPAHAFALLPLAVCIHLAYLSTRSFWAPMAIHFVNNAFAVVALKYMPDKPELIHQAAESAEPSLLVYTASGLCIATLTALLWQMRVEFYLPDGTRWSPGYPAAEVPPEGVAVERRYAWPDWRLATAAAVSGMMLLAAVVYVSLPAAENAVRAM